MSSRAEIVRVHQSETKFKLRPHLTAPVHEPAVLDRDGRGLLCVCLRDLLTPQTFERLKAMGLIR